MTPTPDPVVFLLVDDRPENLRALNALLRRDGLLLLEAKSGTEALEHLLVHDVALALVDVQMPGMDGFELAELMRGTERTRRVPIIFLTAGTADAGRRFRGYEAGAVDFLQKPIETDVLRSKADVFFELGRQRREVARLLEESRRYAEALREADRRKDEFLAMLAHELRNPLAPVRNAVEILRRAASDAAAVSAARDIISRQVAHMARLVDDLLDVARIARGKIQLRAEPCDVAAVVRQTAEDYRPTLLSLGVALGVEVPDRPLPVTGDPTRLAQVVGNLLHNAGKFTPRGGRVDVRAAAEADGAIVTVRDTGAGMDAALLKRLFEPFGQAEQDLERSKGGLGLGLALVKGLVERHGGSVSATSDGPGRGSTLTLRLPLSAAAPAAPAPPKPVPAGRRLRVLIVEDNRDAAESLRLLLNHLGHDAEVAYDGPAAMDAARARTPDVVLSDLGLPGGVDGYSLARALRADPVLGRIALVALSGYAQDEDRRRSEEAGFDLHLVKPVDLAGLEATMAGIAVADGPR